MQAPKKKPKFKRRLEFSASDYKSKKKIRVKSDVFISVTSVEDNHLAISSDDHLSTSDDEVRTNKEVRKKTSLRFTHCQCLFSVLL